MGYARWQPQKSPAWLLGENGEPFQSELGRAKDDQLDRMRQAILAWLPGAAPADALDHIGADRKLPRSTGERNAAYANRLIDAWEAWPFAGSHSGLHKALKLAGFPTGNEGTTIVQFNGRYSQMGSAGSIIVPAYFFPSGGGLTNWNALNTAAASVRLIAIGNPNSGPGTSTNAAYTSAFNSLIAAGGIPIGYVHTSYGARDIADVKDDIDDWVSFYPMIKGIFIDENSNDAADLAYFEEVYDYIRAAIADALVVGNPGVSSLDEDYLTSPDGADTYIIYENDGSPALSVPPYAPAYDKMRFGALLHNSNQAAAEAFAEACRDANVGNVFATSDALPNPWDTLPAYWTTFVAKVAATLDAGDTLQLGTLMNCIHRVNVDGTTTPDPPGWMFDASHTFYSQFGIVFPVDVPTLTNDSDNDERRLLNQIVELWRPAKALYRGAWVIRTGQTLGWPLNRTLGTEPDLGGNTVAHIEP